MGMTLDEALANAMGYAKQKEEAEQRLTAMKKQTDVPTSLLQKQYSLLSEAKMMLKYYQGEKRYNDLGELTYSDAGLIGKLIGEAEQVKNASNLGQRFESRTFGTFDKSRDVNAFNVCVSYASNNDLFRIERNSLIILGGVGSGKTHLASSIANAMIARGIPVLFGTYLEHLEELRREFNSTGERLYLAKMKSTPLLVLDDIGREKQTDWSRQVMFDVINHRYEHMTPIVITTNMSKKDLEAYLGKDVYSRLCEMSAMLETKSGDYRRR